MKSFLFWCLLPLAAFAEVPTVKIGMLLPLSGNNEGWGKEMLKGAQLKIEELNRKHVPLKFKLIAEDDQVTPRMDALGFKKLLDFDHVDAVITCYSGGGNVVKPIAAQKGVLHISSCLDERVADGKWSFINWTRPEDEAILLAKYWRDRGVKDVALIHQNQQGTNASAAAFKETWLAAGGNIVAEEKFAQGERDLRFLIQRIEIGYHPEMYFAIAFSPEMDILMMRFREQRVKGIITSCEGFDLLEDKNLAEGRVFASAVQPTPEFSALIKKRFGEEAKWSHAFAYDDVALIGEAYARAYKATGIISRQAARDELLSQKKYTGAVGELSLDDKGIFHSDAVLFKIEKGKAVRMEDQGSGEGHTP